MASTFLWMGCNVYRRLEGILRLPRGAQSAKTASTGCTGEAAAGEGVNYRQVSSGCFAPTVMVKV